MQRHIHRARSGPHSVHDARQHAWALLVFGPGAPAPRQRPHRGQLPDVPELRASRRRPSLLSRLVALFRGPSAAGEAERADEDMHGWLGQTRQDTQRHVEKDRLAA